MTLTQLMTKVDEAYSDDGLILDYFNDPDGEHGDTLAEFIVREIRDVTKSHTDNKDGHISVEGLGFAMSAMTNARQQLEEVEQAIDQSISEEE